MNLREALNVIGDNPISLMTWGGLLITPINHRLSDIGLTIDLETTGNMAKGYIDKLPPEDQDRLYGLEVDLEHMFVGRPVPAEKPKSNYAFIIAIFVILIVFIMVGVDMASSISKLEGSDIASVLSSILGFLSDVLKP